MNSDKPLAKGERRDGVADTPTEKVGTHSLGATTGAVGGAVAGAVAGLAAGPVGSLVGAAGGAVLGAAAGSSTGVAREIDTAEHDAYWRENYATRPYIPSGAEYDDYEPAYRYGTQSYLRTDHPREWDEVESELGAGWSEAKGRSRLVWEDARHAVRDAWNRMRGVS